MSGVGKVSLPFNSRNNDSPVVHSFLFFDDIQVSSKFKCLGILDTLQYIRESTLIFGRLRLVAPSNFNVPKSPLL